MPQIWTNINEAATAFHETNVYGCTLDVLRRDVERSLKLMSPEMTALSMMSNAQEQIAHGNTEGARQTLNQAKWVLIEYRIKGDK